MNGIRVVAIALIVAGALGLAYGGFTYTKESHQTQIGPLSMTVNERETINVPIWAGVGAIVIGGVLLVFGSTKR